ncbi:MAG: hypothetical protein ACXABY_11345 [Candidatus Thorarchaeota archaeon]
MRIFDFFKSSDGEAQPKLSSEQKAIRAAGRVKNQKILDRLRTQYESLAYELRDVETDVKITKNDRDRVSKRIITKSTFLKHEIEIREDLLRWL